MGAQGVTNAYNFHCSFNFLETHRIALVEKLIYSTIGASFRHRAAAYTDRLFYVKNTNLNKPQNYYPQIGVQMKATFADI